MSPVVTYHNQDMKQPRKQREVCPEYDQVSRSNSNGSRSVHWQSAEESTPLIQRSLSTPRPSDPPPNKRERYVYTYKILAGSTPLELRISVEPASGQPTPGKYTLRLTMKCNGIERVMCEPTVLRLSVDPRNLDFVVFVYPGKSSIPVGSLYSLRVWIRANGVEHRVFSDDELWVGKDLDFYSINGASIMILRNVDNRSQLYHGYVGRALVTFSCRWQRVNENLYKYSIDYDSNGIGGNLIEDLRLRIDGDPRTVTFLIYSVPINSVPAGSSHRIRIWTKSLVNTSSTEPSTLPFQDSYIFQRIHKNDVFKIGAHLDFEKMSTKATMGFAVGSVQTVVMSSPPPPPPLSSSASRSTFSDEKTQKGYI
ncbi:hypothetical protein E4T56_gene8038 [Termitomyces sp. T112]|nr:hypothetical protein E4T56_gene8038 [Termitomyces sp. T112]KAH0588015.1 hypothetical protein H2248_006751 [Termitomyces sp. 'cryptogamus']KNZ76455.1 hypothetical protein J132_10430 [Termitomyces sp. J132]